MLVIENEWDSKFFLQNSKWDHNLIYTHIAYIGNYNECQKFCKEHPDIIIHDHGGRYITHDIINKEDIPIDKKGRYATAWTTSLLSGEILVRTHVDNFDPPLVL